MSHERTNFSVARNFRVVLLVEVVLFLLALVVCSHCFLFTPAPREVKHSRLPEDQQLFGPINELGWSRNGGSRDAFYVEAASIGILGIRADLAMQIIASPRSIQHCLRGRSVVPSQFEGCNAPHHAYL